MKIELNVDASFLVQSSCKLRSKLILVDGFTEKGVFNDTLYGSAFHAFQYMMYVTKGDFAQATSKALEVFARPCEIRGNKKHLNEHHLIKTCHDSWLNFLKNDTFEVLEIEGKPMVEVQFRIKYYEDEFVIVYLTGTIDKFGQIKNGIYSLGDYKVHSLWAVTSKASTKGSGDYYIEQEMDQYFKQYALSLQFTFYTFCLKLMAAEHPESHLHQILKNPIGYFVDGVFISSKDPTRFRRSEIFMVKQHRLDMFKRILDERIKQLVWVAMNPDYNDMDGLIHGACNELKFPCKFYAYCMQQDEVAKQFLLKNNYNQKPYNPMEFGK